MSLHTMTLRNSAFAAALLLASGATLAAPVADVQKKETKSIVIVDSPAVTPLQVQASALKKSYNVGEPIQFKLKANKDVYFYLFSLDEDDNATLLIPNRKVTDNFLAAGRSSVFPSGENMPTLEGDKAGKETLLVVASTKEFNFSDDKEFSTKSIYSQTKAANLKKQFASKDIVWVDASKPEANSANQDNASFYFTVNITSPLPTPVVNQNPTVESLLGGAGASHAGVLADGNMVTVSSDKRKYRTGEAIELVYGTTAAGYIYVYADDNDGNRTLVVRERIKAGELKKKTIEVAKTGKVTLRAYVSKKGDTDYSKAIVIRDDASATPDKEAIAVHTLQVVSK